MLYCKSSFAEYSMLAFLTDLRDRLLNRTAVEANQEVILARLVNSLVTDQYNQFSIDSLASLCSGICEIYNELYRSSHCFFEGEVGESKESREKHELETDWFVPCDLIWQGLYFPLFFFFFSIKQNKTKQ